MTSTTDQSYLSRTVICEEYKWRKYVL